MGYDISLSLVHVYFGIALEIIVIEVRILLFKNYPDTNFHHIFGLQYKVYDYGLQIHSGIHLF